MRSSSLLALVTTSRAVSSWVVPDQSYLTAPHANEETLQPIEQQNEWQTDSIEPLDWLVPPCEQDDSYPGGLEYGVGIDLTTSYATVSIVFADGAVVDIAKIEAHCTYSHMMERLARESSRPSSPSRSTFAQAFAARQRRRERDERKEQGLPATSDVGQLAEVIRMAKHEAELYLWEDLSPSSVRVSVPKLAGLAAEDVADALDYLGLATPVNPAVALDLSTSPLVEDKMDYAPLVAAIANGYGICRSVVLMPVDASSAASLDSQQEYDLHPAELSACLQAKLDRSFPQITALSVTLTKHVFSVLIVSFDPVVNFEPDFVTFKGFQSGGDNKTTTTDFNLAFPSQLSDVTERPSYSDSIASFQYQARLAEALTQAFTRSMSNGQLPLMVFVSGEHGAEPTLQQAIKGAGKKVLGADIEIVGAGRSVAAGDINAQTQQQNAADAMFAAARGAAYNALRQRMGS